MRNFKPIILQVYSHLLSWTFIFGLSLIIFEILSSSIVKALHNLLVFILSIFFILNIIMMVSVPVFLCYYLYREESVSNRVNETIKSSTIRLSILYFVLEILILFFIIYSDSNYSFS